MATTSYGTPMVSSTLPNPMGVTSAAMNKPSGMSSQPMTTSGLQAGTVRNMNLPLSRATPIQVTESTPNLEEIQNFPVAGRGLDGTHFHQDPVTGQMYVMSDELHQRIPEILKNRTLVQNNITQTVIQQAAEEVSSDSFNDYLNSMGTPSTPVVGTPTQQTVTLREETLNLTDTSSQELLNRSIGITPRQQPRTTTQFSGGATTGTMQQGVTQPPFTQTPIQGVDLTTPVNPVVNVNISTQPVGQGVVVSDTTLQPQRYSSTVNRILNASISTTVSLLDDKEYRPTNNFGASFIQPNNMSMSGYNRFIPINRFYNI